MAEKSDMRTRLELAVGIDKATYEKTRNRIDDLFNQQVKLGLDSGDVKDIASKIRNVIETNIGDSIDNKLSGVLNRFADASKDAADAVAKAQLDGTKAAQEQAEMMILHKQAVESELDSILKANKALKKSEEDANAKRLDAAKKLEEISSKSNLKKLEDAGESIASGFTGALNNVKSGDIGGLVESLFGGASKGLAGKAEKTKLAADAASSTEAATALKGAAGTLSAAAVGLAAAGAAITAVIGLMVAADGQAKEFNKSLLEGAAATDFAFTSGAKMGEELNTVLGAGRKAALDMAWAWRGSAAEFTALLSKLNDAGMTYKSMIGDAKTEEEIQERLAGHMETTFKWSKALGISVDETAQAMGTWSADFGMSLESIDKQFKEISEIAQMSGMNTKRFFQAVSQATSGMALYNNRMTEAAGLLMQTQKILGDTDASDFIQSLTKGFADESYTDRFKRIMISGSQDVKKVMVADSMKMARSFKDRFSKDVKLGEVLKGFQVDVMGPPDQMLKQLGGKSDKQIRELVTELRVQGKNTEAREIESMAKIAKASQGGVTEMAKGLDQLSMGGKLAVKMQGMGNKRISEMSGIELAAFEQYAGIGGEQLEQLIRVDRALMGEWEAIQAMSTQQEALSEEQLKFLKEQNITIDKDGKIAKKNADGSITQLSDLNDYTIAHGEILENVAEIQDKATYFARENVAQTESVLGVLQTGVQIVLENIFDVMTSLYNAFVKTDTASIALQEKLLAESKLTQAGLRESLEQNKERLSAAKEKLATTAQSPEAKAKLEAEIAGIEGVITEYSTKLEVERERSSDIAKGKDAAVIAAKYKDTSHVQKAMHGASAVGAGLGFDTQASRDADTAVAAAKAEMERKKRVEGSLAGNTPSKLSVDSASVVGAGGAYLPLTDTQDPLYKTSMLQAEEMATQTSILEKDAETTKKWEKGGGFIKASTESVADGTMEALADQMARGMGFEVGSDKFNTAKADMLAGNGGKYASRIPMGMEDVATKLGLRGGPPMAPDFVMRPGQPAQRFNPSDTIMGVKAGGPLAGGGGGPSTVNITVNGGDQAAVYRTVKDALKSSGLRP